MSKIEVNTVEPQCGTTLTLGACGQTVALGSGAAQTGFGRTGTVDWVTTPKVTGDSPITAVTGKGYFLNTTSGTITVNLPAGVAGSIVSMADYAATWQTYNVTVAANGSEKIGGDTNDATLNTQGQSVTFVYVDSTQGWLNTMDSTSNVRGDTFITATGGTPCAGATCGNCKVHTFTGPGTFTVTQASNVATNNIVSYLVVAGGAGSGYSNYAAGGGGGGFRELASPAAPYTASPLDGYPSVPNRVTVSTDAPYPITVGAGGTAGTPGTDTGRGGSGNDSIFSTITSTAGGGGGAYTGGPTVAQESGLPGGSGGGSAATSSPPKAAGLGNTPPTTPAQGFDGGAGFGCSGGGGGGATTVGATGGPSSPIPGGGGNAGGAGATTQITGSPITKSAGGGGAGGGAPTGPSGGCNTGDGGSHSAGAGGSGIVIIRYKFQ